MMMMILVVLVVHGAVGYHDDVLDKHTTTMAMKIRTLVGTLAEEKARQSTSKERKQKQLSFLNPKP